MATFPRTTTSGGTGTTAPAATRQTITAAGTFPVAATDSVIVIDAAAVGVVAGTLPDAYPASPILIIYRKADATAANVPVRFSRSGAVVEGDAVLDVGYGDTTIARAANGVWYATSGSGGGSAVAASGPLSRVRTASATLELADVERIVEMDVATANTVTVPPQSAVAWPADAVLEVFQAGAGVTSIAAGAGVTLLPGPGALPARYASASLRRRSADVWAVAGLA